MKYVIYESKYKCTSTYPDNDLRVWVKTSGIKILSKMTAYAVNQLP